MDARTKFALVILALLGIAAFFPPNEPFFLVGKIALLAALLAIILTGGVSGTLPKTIQIVVEDVREDRRSTYRNILLRTMSRLGESVQLDEEHGEICIGVKTKRPMEDVKKAADKCDAKMQFDSLNYS